MDILTLIMTLAMLIALIEPSNQTQHLLPDVTLVKSDTELLGQRILAPVNSRISAV